MLCFDVLFTFCSDEDESSEDESEESDEDLDELISQKDGLSCHLESKYLYCCEKYNLCFPLQKKETISFVCIT